MGLLAKMFGPRPERPWTGRIIAHRMPNAWGRNLQDGHAWGLNLYRGAIVCRLERDGAIRCREILSVRPAGDPPDMQFYTYRPIEAEEANRHLAEVQEAFELGGGAR